MNVNTAIKNVEAELKTIQSENKKFTNSDVSDGIKQIKETINNIKTMRDEMLELDGKLYDNRESIKRKVNFIYGQMGNCYYNFSKNCDTIKDTLERLNTQEKYLNEFDRLRNTEI